MNQSAWDSLAQFALVTSTYRPPTSYYPYLSWTKNAFQVFNDYLCRFRHPTAFLIASLIPALGAFIKLGHSRNRWFPSWFPSLILRMPNLLKMFQSYSFRNPLLYIMAAVLSVISSRWRAALHTPQQMSDVYNAYFHADPYKLSFNTELVHTGSKGFYSDDVAALIPPDEPNKTTQAPYTAFVPDFQTAPVLSEVLTSAPNQHTASTCSQMPKETSPAIDQTVPV